MEIDVLLYVWIVLACFVTLFLINSCCKELPGVAPCRLKVFRACSSPQTGKRHRVKPVNIVETVAVCQWANRRMGQWAKVRIGEAIVAPGGTIARLRN